MGKRTLWLVGMMGAGKSSVGSALARRLARRFVDADAEIERAAGCTIAAIFAREGEAGFRAREREAIEALLGAEAVVALGGGAFAQPGLAERVLAAGPVVYLRASAESLVERVGEAADRPLLAGLGREARRARLVQLLAERAAAYARASLVVDTDGLSVEEVVEATLARLPGAGPGRAPARARAER
jgi:shikimate kinase